MIQTALGMLIQTYLCDQKESDEEHSVLSITSVLNGFNSNSVTGCHRRRNVFICVNALSHFARVCHSSELSLLDLLVPVSLQLHKPHCKGRWPQLAYNRQIHVRAQSASGFSLQNEIGFPSTKWLRCKIPAYRECSHCLQCNIWRRFHRRTLHKFSSQHSVCNQCIKVFYVVV